VQPGGIPQTTNQKKTMKKSDKLRASMEATATTSSDAAPVLREAVPATPPFNARLIAIERIYPSPTNPRKHFKPDAQAELEGSMRAKGFTLSTLLVRPQPDTFFLDTVTEGQFFVMRRTPAGIEASVEMLPTLDQAEALLKKLEGRFELVAGERRWRAAQAVGIGEAPCIVAPLTDAEVIEIQLIENLQREDLTAMETAMGFRQLLDLRDAAGAPLFSKQALHERTGKSVDMIDRHLRLCVLASDPGLKDFLKAFEAGTVGIRHAMVVVSVPDHASRAKLAKEILAPQHEEAPLSVRKAELLKQRDYLKDLRGVPFDLKDASILPVLVAEGERVGGLDCFSCPNRLGNNPTLMSGELRGNADMCMNPSCLTKKREAGWKQWQDGETDPEKKRRALGEAECRRLYQHGDQLVWNCGLVDLAERPDSNDLKAGQPSPGTWKKMIGDQEIEVQVVRDRNGRRHELVDRKLAMLAAKANGFDVFKEAKASKDSQPELESGASGLAGAMRQAQQESAEERAARILKSAHDWEIKMEVRMAVGADIAEKAATGKALPAGFWPEVVSAMGDDLYEDAFEPIERRRGWPIGKMQSEMKKLEAHHQVGVVAELLWHAGECYGPGGQHVAKMFGVDEKAVGKKTTERVKEEQKKRAALRKEIAKLAAAQGVAPKKLDEMAKGTKGKQPFLTLDDAASLEELLTALRGKAESGERKPESLSPAGRAKMAAAVKARWSKRARGAAAN